MPTVSVNGKEREVNAGATVLDLLTSLALQPRIVAVEYNREILKRVLYSDTELCDGDGLEIVRFVQGG